MTITRRVALVVLMLALAASATGCRRVLLDEDQRVSRSDAMDKPAVSDASKVSLEGAEKLDVDLRMGAGRLTVSGGAPEGDALAAEFDFSPDEWEPRVSYEVQGDRGELKVIQPPLDFTLGGNRNDWDLRLASGVPLRLDLELGAGDSDIDLTGTRLEELDIDLGAGEATVDLSGEWDHDVVARIEAGVGRLEIKVPASVGVLITGERQGIGEFSADGFERRGGDLVNDAYGTAEHTIELDVNQGVGEIVIVTVD